MADEYKVIRFFQNGGKRVVTTGLTLEQAQEWCSDPEGSSSTATGKTAKARTRRSGAWFEGFEKQ